VREILFLARAVFAGALVLASASDAGAVNIERIRHASGDDYTRIVIDIDGAASYRAAFAAADPVRGVPPRFFVDLSGAGLQRAMLRDFEVGDRRVARVRAGQFNERTARVVMDLAGPVKPKVFTLSAPARVVVDLADAPGHSGSGSGQVVARVAAPQPHSSPSSRPQAAQAASAKVSSVARPVTAARPEAAAVAGPAPTPVPAPASEAAAADPIVIARSEPPPARPAVVPAVKSSPRRADPAAPWTIVIDPGHGGDDPGALGPAGHREKDVTLAIAHKLASKLRSGLGANVILTRNGDATLSLAERKDVANAREADLFVSIHANASVRADAEGIETYYLKNSNDRATLRLAKLENGVDPLIKGTDISRDADLPFILSDMVQGSKEAESISLARQIQGELVRSVQPRYKAVRDLGVKQGPFYVLDGTYMPSVLVETGFITHSAEGARIRSSSYQDLIAEGIYRGIRRHLEDESVAGVY
jgi:N-acetylmuramoyl-L-alanine amidase